MLRFADVLLNEADNDVADGCRSGVGAEMDDDVANVRMSDLDDGCDGIPAVEITLFARAPP